MALIILETSIFICVAFFAGIGVWALRRKDPMHLWTGTTVPTESITDIKKYNRANAIMWFCFCLPLVVSMIAAPIFGIIPAAIILGIACLPGIGVVVLVYNRILRKYQVPGSKRYEEI